MTTASEKYVFLITSDTYKDDILNLLCLEKGMRYRFRYREEWIPMEFFERDNQGREKYLGLVGKNGLVIFFDISKREFFPIMRVVIHQVEKLGDILHVEFTVSELIRYGIEDEGVNEYHSLIQKCIPKEYISGMPWALKKFILLTNIPINEIVTNDDLISWSRILHKIWHLGAFKKSLFLKILKIIDSKGTVLRPQEVSSKTKEVGYVLSSSEIYKLEILQRAKDDFPTFDPFKLKLLFVGDHIITIKESAMIVGKYDKLGLTLRTKWRKSDTISIIGLRSDKKVDIDLPEVYIPLKIKKDIVKLAGSVFTIITGCLVAASSGYIPQLLGLSEALSPLLGFLGAVFVALGVAWLRPMYE